jgi:hypothetical protein
VGFGGGEILDLRSFEELSEDECVWGGGCPRDEVGGGEGRGSRFGEGEEGLQVDVGFKMKRGLWRGELGTSRAFKALVCSILNVVL